MNQAQIAAAAAAAAIALAGGAQTADVEAAARQAADAVAAGTAGDAAINGALTTARNLAAKQLVREQFSLGVAQAKAVLNPQVVLMLMLYPCVIAFTLAARYTKYGLLIPTPNVPGAAPPSPDLARAQDEWLTTSQEALWFTGICFGAVSLIHIFLVFYITLKGPRESPRMSRAFAWLAPMAFWFGTCAYFFVFTILARYGVAWQEWVLFRSICIGAVFYHCNSHLCGRFAGEGGRSSSCSSARGRRARPGESVGRKVKGEQDGIVM